MTAVQFTQPMPVTNAACCSDSKVMCGNCAAASLAVANGQPPPGYAPVVRYEPVLDEEPLLAPVLNFGPAPTPPAGEVLIHNVNDTDAWNARFARDVADRQRANARLTGREPLEPAQVPTTNDGSEPPLLPPSYQFRRPGG